MQRDAVYLVDIIEAAKLALSYAKDIDKSTFIENTQIQDSVIRRIEIIGEAARRLSDEIKAQYPELPWKEMIGIRNLLIHEYDDVDMSIVWQTVQHNLPTLIAQLETINLD